MNKINPYHTSAKQQKGVTIIEVIISIFIITIALLTLLTVQIKTYSNLADSESIKIVTIATQNLAKSISLNPYVQHNKNKIQEYYQLDDCNKVRPIVTTHETSIDENDLTQQHLLDFCQTISEIENFKLSDIKLKVCLNDHINGNLDFDFKCKNTLNTKENSDQGNSVIKVVWKGQKPLSTQNDDDETFLSYELPLDE